MVNRRPLAHANGHICLLLHLFIFVLQSGGAPPNFANRFYFLAYWLMAILYDKHNGKVKDETASPPLGEAACRKAIRVGLLRRH